MNVRQSDECDVGRVSPLTKNPVLYIYYSGEALLMDKVAQELQKKCSSEHHGAFVSNPSNLVLC